VVGVKAFERDNIFEREREKLFLLFVLSCLCLFLLFASLPSF
jgi:hypothetical protein